MSKIEEWGIEDLIGCIDAIYELRTNHNTLTEKVYRLAQDGHEHQMSLTNKVNIDGILDGLIKVFTPAQFAKIGMDTDTSGDGVGMYQEGGRTFCLNCHQPVDGVQETIPPPKNEGWNIKGDTPLPESSTDIIARLNKELAFAEGRVEALHHINAQLREDSK